MKKGFLAALLLSIFNQSIAQTFSVSGVVKDAETDKPLVSARVFVVNTSNTTTTNEKGEYALTNIQLGTTAIAVMKPDYEAVRQTVRSEQAANKTVDFAIGSVAKIAVKRDKKWEKLAKRFQAVLLGEGIFSGTCTIKNLDQVEFTEEGDKVLASASQPLDIENVALGYKLQYVLTKCQFSDADGQFQGYAFFEELAGGDAQKNMLNRAIAFDGSERHFFQTLAQKSVENYELFVDKPGSNPASRSKNFFTQLDKTIERIKVDSLLKQGKIAGEFSLKFPKRVEIHHKSDFLKGKFYNDDPRLISWLETLKDINFNQQGVVQNPAFLVSAGFFNSKKVADLVPTDYSPKKVIVNEAMTPEKQKVLYSLQERVELNTNKHYYRPGENIWLSGRIIHVDTSMEASLSRLVYVELISPSGKIMQRQKLIGNPLIFSGLLNTETDFEKGNYRIRAYTNWMRNFGDETFYNQIVPLVANDEYVFAKPSTQKIDKQITDKKVYKSREKVSITLDSTRFGDFSFSVLDTSAVKASGNSFVPNLPFKQADSFKQMLDFKFFAETGLRISGTVTNRKGEAEPNATLLFYFGGTKNTAMAMSDELGKFDLNGLQLFDTLTYTCKAQTEKGKELNIVLDEQPDAAMVLPWGADQQFTIKKLPSAILFETDIDLPKDAILLDEVAVKAKKKEKQVEIKPVYGNADYTIKGKDLTGSVRGINPILALQGKVPGLRIVDGADGTIKVNIRGANSFSGSTEPLYLIDGTPVDNVADLNAIPFDRIDRIEVLKTARAVFGSRGANGVIAIYTKNAVDRTGDDAAFESVKTYKMLGINQFPDFTSPNYGLGASSKADIRSVIFWKPQVGKGQFSFYTADETGTYKILLNRGAESFYYIFEVR